MNRMVRPMSRADVPAVASLHELAFAGSLGVALGTTYVRRMLEQFLVARDAICLVHEVDGGLAGYVFGAPDVEWPLLNRRMLPSIALAVLAHPNVLLYPACRRKTVGRLKSVVLRVTPIASHTPQQQTRAPAPVYDLVGIGVHPRSRGRGVAQALMAAFEQEATRRGYRSLLLSAHADNRAARRLYEGRRWAVLSEAEGAVYYLKTFDAPHDSGPNAMEGVP